MRCMEESFYLNSPTGTWQNKPYKGSEIGRTKGSTWNGGFRCQVFQEIGNLCGGWVATEEETELKNHMMWARIMVENDGRNIPKEVSISRYGVVYHFPIWAESHVRVEVLSEVGKGDPGAVGEENKRSTIPPFTQRSIGCKACKVC
ncbi:hypothetical protein MTR67_040082 [Solanum verrucosum]|uniref:Uncharacterized protein n=1 Tax=Solanum verrucosum TaxID=315347 RepID=A0AAF0ZP53_SOLVR|nr:hypothetical protein MTR67_040082 [Solanum verrucosum]